MEEFSMVTTMLVLAAVSMPHGYEDVRSIRPAAETDVVRVAGGMRQQKVRRHRYGPRWRNHWVRGHLVKSRGSQGRINESYGQVWAVPVQSPGVQPCEEDSMNDLRCGCNLTLEAQYSMEEARWPDRCLNLSIYHDWRSFPGEGVMGLSRSQVEELAVRSNKSWMKAINVRLSLTDDPSRASYIRRFERLSGSVLAWSHLADNTCGQKQQRYDIRRWSEHLLYLVFLHEDGHMFGLTHSNGGIMNPSILTHLEGLTDMDIRRALALGYKPGRDVPDDDDDDDDEDDDMDWLSLMQLILEVVAKCLDEEDESRVYGRLRNPRLGARLQMMRIARRQGIRGRAERKEFVQQLEAELTGASDQELRDLISEAQDINA